MDQGAQCPHIDFGVGLQVRIPNYQLGSLEARGSDIKSGEALVLLWHHFGLAKVAELDHTVFHEHISWLQVSVAHIPMFPHMVKSLDDLANDVNHLFLREPDFFAVEFLLLIEIELEIFNFLIEHFI